MINMASMDERNEGGKLPGKQGIESWATTEVLQFFRVQDEYV